MVRPPAVRGLAGGAPITQRDAQRRRRDILFGLATLAALTTFGAVSLGGPAIWLAVVGWGLVAGYLLMLTRARQIAAEHEAKVHYLQPVGGHQEPRDVQGNEAGPAQEIFYDDHGYPVDQYGRPCDDYGRLVDQDGYLIDADGYRVDEDGYRVDHHDQFGPTRSYA